MGMMSNRTYDALSAGASVICDPVLGFDDQSLPNLFFAQTADEVLALAEPILAGALSLDERLQRHETIAAALDFDAVAKTFIDRAWPLIVGRQSAPLVWPSLPSEPRQLDWGRAAAPTRPKILWCPEQNELTANWLKQVDAGFVVVTEPADLDRLTQGDEAILPDPALLASIPPRHWPPLPWVF